LCYAKASQLLNRRCRMKLYAGIDLHANISLILLELQLL
jgi:hypothetical protein